MLGSFFVSVLGSYFMPVLGLHFVTVSGSHFVPVLGSYFVTVLEFVFRGRFGLVCRACFQGILYWFWGRTGVHYDLNMFLSQHGF